MKNEKTKQIDSATLDGLEHSEALYKEPDGKEISDFGGPQNGLIFKRIADVMSKISPVGKDSRNKQQKYNFRSIDQVYNMVQPIMAEHRVFTIPMIVSKDREERETKSGGTLITTLMWVKFRFYTDDGSYIEATTQGEGMDSGDKSSNKAMTSAHKYAIIMVFNIPTAEQNDGDFDSPEGEGLKPKQLKDSPSKYQELKKLQQAIPDKHPLSKVDLDNMSLSDAQPWYEFMALFVNVMEGIKQIDERQDITPEEIKGFKRNLMKCTNKNDVEVLIDSLPTPKKNGKSQDKDNKKKLTPADINKQVDNAELPFK